MYKTTGGLDDGDDGNFGGPIDPLGPGRLASNLIESMASALKRDHRMYSAPDEVVRLITPETAWQDLKEARILLTMLLEAQAEVGDDYEETESDYRAILYVREVVDIFLKQTVPDLQFVACEDADLEAQDAPAQELTHLITIAKKIVQELERIYRQQQPPQGSQQP